jgi:methanogenic corrinoid protein MtbC1
MGELQAFYLHIVQPVMYEIGRMWENAEISVAQEHLASAVVARVLAATGGSRIFTGYRKGRALVTTVQNEFHEIGAWMISDILEQDGWQVRYLGSNTPREDLLRMLDDYLPDLLAVSVTMAFNLDNLNSLLAEIRSNPLHGDMPVMIGGRVFLDSPELVADMNVHSFAHSLQEAQLLAGSRVEVRGK